MSASNHFGVLTCLAALVCLPMAYAAEGSTAMAAWKAAAPTRQESVQLAIKVGQTGLYFYGCAPRAALALTPRLHAPARARAATRRWR